jgi:hypothetical protein
MGGCISPDLDSVATSKERCEQLLALMATALNRLLGKENRPLQQELVVEHWAGFGERDVALQAFIDALPGEGRQNLIRLGRQFVKLLRGEVVTGPADPDALMPWGE